MLTKKEKKKVKKPRKRKEKRKVLIRRFLDKAGISKEIAEIYRTTKIIAIAMDIVFYAVLCYFLFTRYEFSFLYFVFLTLIVGGLGYFAMLFIEWIIFYFFLDLRIYKRKVAIENVLPDFLQLASANIKSGMPIDRALWLAVRPRFGVLAKEIETVAKQTMTGEDLEGALKIFADKYDSMTLKRAVSLIIEGLKSGGEIGDILDRIAKDIKDTQILRKEMAANLTTYVIFITFATVIAAPFLFGLTNQLLQIVQEVTSNIQVSPSTNTGIGVGLGEAGINTSDFRIFAISMLAVTSLFSSLIIATIKKGEVKAGLKYIPMFMASTILLFFFSSWVLGKIFAGMF